MRRVAKMGLLVVLGCSMLSLYGCKQKSGSDKGGGDEKDDDADGKDDADDDNNADANPTNTNTNTNTSTGGSTTVDCSTLTATGTSTDATGGIGLTGQITYDNTIRTILQDKCVTCHTTGSVVNFPDFASAKANATRIIGVMNGSPRQMPPADRPQLTADEKSKFQQWINGGLLQNDTTTGGTTTDCTDQNPVVSTDPVIDDSDDLWDDLINPDGLDTCRTQGKVYERSKDACHRASIATTFQCTQQGIVDKFKSIGINVAPDVTGLLQSGFVIDQCGEVGADPVVLFYKKVEGQEELKLQIKRLCKKGSNLCES